MPLWEGRFSGQSGEEHRMDPQAWALNSSLGFDRRLAAQDVRGSLAWARAIAQAGVLTAEECERICNGLKAIGLELHNGRFAFQPDDEDIHTAVERRLDELIGPTAGKLHTGRSRNDQVATDFRLWILESLPELGKALIDFQGALLEQAQAGLEVLVPGYTHLQRAQPILLAHWWLSFFWPLQRDRQRLDQLSRRTAVLPLGSGALAGTPFAVDRQALAESLGFAEASPNSLDAVSDRDFAAEFLFCAALVGSHLSKLAEAVVLFSSAEFGYFELSDVYATGSSLMPQKKNPDIFELARGKAGALAGALMGLLATLKGLPSTYDKDLQEDKPPVFLAYDTLAALLPALAGAVRTLTVRPERMRLAIDASMMATDLADYLVAKGQPFRQAHGLAGHAVQLSIQQKIPLDKLPLEAYRSLDPVFEADVFEVFDPQCSVERRRSLGGTAPEAVRAQLEEAKRALNKG